MTIRTLTTEEPAYERMKSLRWEVLLQPIGVPYSYINPEKEASDILVAAFDENDMVGCCILTPLSTRTVQLRQMAVSSTLQGKGVGRAIVTASEKIAKEKGFSELMMHARDVVIPFYEKCGYIIDGEGFTEVGIPHHKMKKAL